MNQMAHSSCAVCGCSIRFTACEACIKNAKEELSHGCDGPITDFVLISRACRLAASGKFGAPEVANALDEVLREYGFLKEHNPILMTGS